MIAIDSGDFACGDAENRGALPRARCRAMFVRVKKIGAYEYLYLVENAREGGRHVQRVIQGARPPRRGRGLASDRRADRLGGAPFAALARFVELLSRPVHIAASSPHRTPLGLRPAI